MKRFLAWSLIVLLLPVFTIGFIRGMVRRESNAANAVTLAIYTGVDAILAYLLLVRGLSAWGPVLAWLGAVGAASLYNLYVMSFAVRLEAS